RRGVGTVVDEELVHDGVDLVGADPGLAVLAGEDDGLGGQPAGPAHPIDHVGCLHGRVRPLGLPLADVLRSGDAGRHLAPRGELTGSQRASRAHHPSLAFRHVSAGNPSMLVALRSLWYSAISSSLLRAAQSRNRSRSPTYSISGTAKPHESLTRSTRTWMIA